MEGNLNINQKFKRINPKYNDIGVIFMKKRAGKSIMRCFFVVFLTGLLFMHL